MGVSTSLRYFKFIIFLLIGILINYIVSFFPYLVENFYSNIIYKYFGQVLSTITGFFPFSLSELILIVIIVYILGYLFIIIINILKGTSKFYDTFINFIKNTIYFISILYFTFVIIWGLNYHRLPLEKILGLDTSPSTVKELEDLCNNLIITANELRNQVTEDIEGIMLIPGGYKSVFKRANKGFIEAGKIIDELKGKYGIPKKVFFSNFLSYAGISGIYFPFTFEANVNTLLPDSMLPSTVCHEMAHQRGFAREDEANYIAYMVCRMHPDTDFQYSGILLALIHSMNTLYKYDKEKYLKLKELYSDGLKRDLNRVKNFWISYKGPIEEISNKINDTYLKLNYQKDGVYSYGRMVDLLIAEYKLKK